MKEITEGTAEQVMAHVREVLPHAYPDSECYPISTELNLRRIFENLDVPLVTEELVIHTNLFRVGDTDSWRCRP